MTGFGRPQRFRKLLVAPFNLRAQLEEIRGQRPPDGGRAHPPQGERAVDPTIVDELYAASGRREIEIWPGDLHAPARGEGAQGEHPRPLDLGRFLEHSRLYSFEAGDVPRLLGSADLMPRNLDRRIEVLVPVESAHGRQELQTILDSVFADNVRAWVLSPDGTWAPLEPRQGAAGRWTIRRR